MDELIRDRERRLRRELHGHPRRPIPSKNALKRFQRLVKGALQTTVPVILAVADKRQPGETRIGVFGMPDGAGYFVCYPDDRTG